MGYGDMMERSLAKLQEVTKEFTRSVSSIDNNFDSKISEIKVIENKLESLKEVHLEKKSQADRILQDATEEASRIRKANEGLISEARMAQQQASEDRIEANKVKADAQVYIKEVKERQTTLDVQTTIFDRKKKAVDLAWTGK